MTRYTDNAHGGTALSAHMRNSWKAVSHGLGWRVAARISLCALGILALLLYIIGTPAYFTWTSTLCTNCPDERLTPAQAQSLHTLGVSITAYAAFWTAINLLFALVYAAMAGFIFWRKPADRMAWFAAFSLTALGASFPDIPNALVSLHPIWRLPVALLDSLGLPALTAFLFLFPTGHFVPRWTRWLSLGFAALYALSTFFPGTIVNFRYWPRLLTLPIPLAWLVLLVFAQVYRYWQVSTPVERQQTKWVVFGSSIALLGFLLLAFLPLALIPLFFPLEHLGLFPSLFLIPSIYLLLLLIPLSMAVAILRYRLWDIDIIIHRALVYGILTVGIACGYIAIVGLLGALLQARGNLLISLLAAGWVAIVFQPLRSWLQRAVSRLMYGERDDPYRVISQLGQRLEATLAPTAVLPTIVETVAQALKLPYAAICLRRDEAFPIAAAYGEAQEDVVRFPLIYQKEHIGELLLAPRARGETFSPADHRLLEDLARQAGIAAHAVRLDTDLQRLTRDLQRSRERLVTTREEERRRLRRDLHDGLGPQLASLTLKLETARNRLAHDPLADTLLSDLTRRTQNAVADIRHLVYDLRPPALDELGLISALREQALQFQGQHERLSISIAALLPLPPLPAAVEVAIFRIVQEALTNVVRHAQASHCTVCLELDEANALLRLEIEDDGRGLPGERKLGVGLHSMRERAEELGGTWSIESRHDRGARISAQLPLNLPASVDEADKLPLTVSSEEG